MNRQSWIGFLRLCGRMAIRQTRARKNLTISIVLNMSLGLTGLLTVDGFNSSFKGELYKRARQIASGDLVISSRQPYTDQALRDIGGAIPTGSRMTEEVSLVSMLASSDSTRMVEARFVDDAFPFYPGPKTADEDSPRAALGSRIGAGKIFVSKDLRAQMGVQAGQVVSLGKMSFEITGVIDDDPTSGAGGFSFAPRVYLSLDDIDATGLVGFGSRQMFYRRYLLPADVKASEISESLKKITASYAQNLDLRIRGFESVTDEVSRVQLYLNDYLSLVALAALFLASVGIAYLAHSMLESSMREFAILSALGGVRWMGAVVFSAQIFMIAFMSAALAIIISLGTLPILAAYMAPVAGQIAVVAPPFMSVVRVSMYAVASGLLLTFPLCLSISSARPGILFQESAAGGIGLTTWQKALFIPSFVLWWLTAVLFSGSWRTGSVFAAACASAGIILFALSVPMASLSVRFARSGIMNWRVALATRMVSRNRLATVSTFTALSMGSALICLIPQLRTAIAGEVSRPDTVIPALFMFDIQDEQLDDARRVISENGGTLSTPSPMVRARLETINGSPVADRKVDFEGDRDQRQRESLQARTQNLSWREKTGPGESVIAGEWFAAKYTGQGPVGLSVEEGFAKRLGLKTGDRMDFDVSGVPFQGVIGSVRKVRWSSFEPNFMILVQPGALDDAPKVWVASASGMSVTQINKAQTELVKTHPNITMVDLKDAVRRFLLFIDQSGSAISVVAWIALIGALGVLFAISYSRVSSRVKFTAILRAVGGSSGDARVVILIEYFIIALTAVVCGTLLGFVSGGLIVVYGLKAPWTISLAAETLYSLAVLPAAVILAWISTLRVTKTSVLSLLGR